MTDKENRDLLAPDFNLKGASASEVELLRERGAELLRDFADETRKTLMANGMTTSESEQLKERGSKLLRGFAAESRETLMANGINPDKELSKAKEKYGGSPFFD